MRRALLAALLLGAAALAAPGAARAAPERDVHALRWFVHVDLLAPLGRDLAFYQDLIRRRSAEADLLLQGVQGPADTGCCSSLEVISVDTFGAPGDGLDVILTDAELDAVAANGPGVYLVRSVFCCGCGGTPNMSTLACADTPGSFLATSLDAEDAGLFPGTLAHERGHNAGLLHVTDNPCQLMAPFGGGSCMSPSECTSFRNAGNQVSGACECLADAVADPPPADGSSCTHGSGCGLCSGGACGGCDSLAGARMVASAGTAAPEGDPSDEAVTHSALAGGWTPQGSAALGAEVTGLAYATRRGILYGIERGDASGDLLITVDPETGRKLGEVGPLLGQTGVAALAYDPGPEPGGAAASTLGDRLLAIQVDDEIFGQTFACPDSPVCFSTLIEVDPDDASVQVLGDVEPNRLVVPDGVTGLAYDPAAAVLYGASIAGLHRIDPSCPNQVCPVEQVDDAFRRPVSLGFDPGAGRLVRVGSQVRETFFDVIDPLSGGTEESLSLDPLAPGAAAAVPVPEPGTTLAWLAAAGALVGGLWRRHGRAPRL